jgi:hypothetical protein
MMDRDRFEAGKATHDLDTSQMDHDAVARPVWAALEATIAARNPMSAGDQILCQLLRGMKETHHSMQAVYGAAVDIERAEGQSGCWIDMLLLARAQFDAVFNGLLVADDAARWASVYKKAGWKTMAQRHFYELRRFGSTPAGRALKTANVPRLQRLARWAGVTDAEWKATEAEVNGITAPPGPKKPPDFPTPGRALRELKTASFQELGRLLYPHWKFLCDAAHAGPATLLLRALIQQIVPGKAVPAKARDDFIYKHAAGSLRSSLAASLTLVTVAALAHRSDADLSGRIVTAWGPLEKGTVEGNVIWHQWARDALGVLSVRRKSHLDNAV